MKMDAALVERTLDQIEAQAIPDNHPAVPELNKIYGDHTFFIDGDGLAIVEPAEQDAEIGVIVKLASWSDEKRTGLYPHDPEPTDRVIELGVEDGSAT